MEGVKLKKGSPYHKQPPLFEVYVPQGGVHYAQSPRGLISVLNKLGCTLKPELWDRVKYHYELCSGTTTLMVISTNDFIVNPLFEKEEVIA